MQHVEDKTNNELLREALTEALDTCTARQQKILLYADHDNRSFKEIGRGCLYTMKQSDKKPKKYLGTFAPAKEDYWNHFFFNKKREVPRSFNKFLSYVLRLKSVL